jgi:hypothetical protein
MERGIRFPRFLFCLRSPLSSALISAVFVFSAAFTWRTSRLRTFPDCAKIKTLNRKVRQGSAKLAKNIAKQIRALPTHESHPASLLLHVIIKRCLLAEIAFCRLTGASDS